jgi:hypothetical protein
MKRMANGDKRWPVKNAPLPLPGAILPFKRIVAYYGNMYSKNMGALGQYEPTEMRRRLMAEVKFGKPPIRLHPLSRSCIIYA